MFVVVVADNSNMTGIQGIVGCRCVVVCTSANEQKELQYIHFLSEFSERIYCGRQFCRRHKSFLGKYVFRTHVKLHIWRTMYGIEGHIV